jgi:DNA-binding NarL/FixJ family response regulator
MYPMTDRPQEIKEDASVQAPAPVSIKITGRERDLINAIQRGLSNREIAQELRISEQTVKNQLTQLYSKLQVKTRLQLLIKTLSLD